MLWVIAAPIISGDTALRSARLLMADVFRLDQKLISRRMMIVIPLFLVTFVVLQADFGVIWRYFAWANHTLAVFTLWALTIYLVRGGGYYWITLISAMFMTYVSIAYILTGWRWFWIAGQCVLCDWSEFERCDTFYACH